MTEPAEFKRFDAFLLGALLAFLVTMIPMKIWGVEKWHERTCVERFKQAETPSDSLSVIRQDSFCNTIMNR